MIVIYINGEGTAEKLSPQHVYQGSNQTGVTVFAPVPTTTAISIAFKLPDGTSSPYYPMTFIQSVEGLSQYEFTIPSSITQLAGHASIALRALYSDGQQTSQLIDFEIEPSLLPQSTEDIDQSAYDIILRYLQQDRSDITTLQGQIDNFQETANSAQETSVNAVETANEAKEIAQAAEGTADKAAEDVANYKSDVNQEISGFETQLEDIRKQLALGTSVYRGDLPEDESAFDRILASLADDPYQIYRIPAEYPMEDISDLFPEGYDNTFPGLITFFGGVVDMGAEIITLNVSVVDGVGRAADTVLVMAGEYEVSRTTTPLGLEKNALDYLQYKDFGSYVPDSPGLWVVALSARIGGSTLNIPPQVMAVYGQGSSGGQNNYGSFSYSDGANSYQVRLNGAAAWTVYNATTQENATDISCYLTKL